MPFSSNDLWKLLQESRLVAPDRLEQIEIAFRDLEAAKERTSAKRLAEWLVGRGILTRYQAGLLLGGRSGPFRYGDYQIQDRIRGGRLTGLFQAIHIPSRYQVLLRFVPNRIAQDPRQWTITRQYIRNVSPITHAQLQRVFGLEERSNYKFLVLEDLSGHSLEDELAAEGRLAPGKVCQYVRLAAVGLAALHQRRQIHGDLRPASLWRESWGNVKLLRHTVEPSRIPDFSRPGLKPPQLQQADYLAPELAQLGTRLSPLTDIYALGCTLYELLTGQVPFCGGEPAEKSRRHATESPPSLDSVGVPTQLAAVVGRMMAKDADARLSSAEDVAAQLAPFIETAKLTVLSPPPTATLTKFEQALGQPVSGLPTPPEPAPPQPTRPSVASSQHAPPQTAPPEIDAPQPAAPVAHSVEPPTGTTAAEEIQVVEARGSGQTRRRVLRTRQAQRRRAVLLSLLAAVVLLAFLAYIVIDHEIRRRVTDGGNAPRPPQGHLDDASARRSGASKLRDPGDDVAPKVDIRYEVRNDDGSLLWMTPTVGDPIELGYVPPGPQMIIVLRPHDLARSPEGIQVLQALGTEFEEYRRDWESVVGFAWDEIDQLVISFHDAGEPFPRLSYVVSLSASRAEDELLRAWGNPTALNHASKPYYSAQEWYFYIPDLSKRTRFVMSGEQTIKEVIEFGETSPVMQRPMAQLLQTSDRDRHLSILFSPRFLYENLFRDGREFSFGDGRQVRRPLEWLLEDGLQACIVSMQFADSFYLELRGCGPANQDSLGLADALRQRIEEIPERVLAHFEQIYPSKYWRSVALKLPEMIRFLHDHTRVGVEDDQAIVNSVLPGPAAHNLFFAGQMLLAAQLGQESPSSRPSTAGPRSLSDLIATRMTLKFDQKSLEFAMRDLASDIKESHPVLPFAFDIKILGTDLQLNGITRNQQITDYEATEKTLGEILTALVMRANPVTTVTKSSESDQKLIWVIGPDPSDPKRQILLITTRDAAAREGYKLPKPFQPQ